MSRDPTSPKSLLRTQARTRRAHLAAALPDFAARIATFADALGLAPGAVVAGYRAVRDEADPALLMAALAAKGHALALPRIAAKDAALHFHRWREGDDLFDNHHGIAEPHHTAERITPDVILVPLLAFDAAGHRLGYGGGFFDRTLAETGVTSIGIAYAGQEIALLPHSSHDVALDAILTEQGLRKFL